jgi:hypothetical protein
VLTLGRERLIRLVVYAERIEEPHTSRAFGSEESVSSQTNESGMKSSMTNLLTAATASSMVMI